MELVNIAELKSHLSDVIAKVNETGTAVIIGKYGKPVAKLIPFSDGKKNRVLGFGKHLLMSRLFKVLCQHKNTQPISSQVECAIKPTFKEDGQLG